MSQKADFDQWVLDWIKDEKEKGRKCFDVKRSGNSYYVYYQTTRYNSQTKKREKVSGYMGKLVQGIGLVEPDGSDGDFGAEEVSSARYGLGVDTGGTYTDAVIVDLDDMSVVAKRKSLTTHDDLFKGLHDSVKAVFESSDVLPQDISLVGISTTLATNSVLESAGGEVGLLLIGWEPMGKASFGEKHQATVRGGFDTKGRAVEVMNENEVREALKKIGRDVDAIAISGLFAVTNPSQEKRAKELAKEVTGLPTVAGHELSAALGIDLRAETAVLNGKLIPEVSRFFDNVERTFKDMGVTAPIMAYKGDGSVMTLDEARLFPVETILSGPAASSVGGTVLSGLEDCIVVDIGGTSTDIAVMDEGFPQIRQEGAAIGKWRTRVKAVDMYTIALGGDSRISMKDGRFLIGPERVIPLSTFADEHPGIIERLLHNNIFDYYVAVDGFPEDGMTVNERKVYGAMKGKGPMDSMQVRNGTEGLWIIGNELRSLTMKGAIRASSLTPTDVMVFLGKFRHGSEKGAEAAVRAMAETQGMAPLQIAGMLFEEIKVRVSEAVATKMLDDEMEGWNDAGSRKLVRKMASLSRDRGMDILPRVKVPIVGIGAPAAYMMEDIGERLGTYQVFPDDHDVGNAVGAVSSKVAESLTAVLQPTVDNRFSAAIPFMGTTYYSHRDNAVGSAKKAMEEYLTARIKRSGCSNIKVTHRTKTYRAAEGGYGNWDDLATNITFIEVTTRVVGDPPMRS